MKKIITLLAGSASLFCSAQYISFDYDGALSSNGWARHSGTTGEMKTLTTASDLGASLSHALLPQSKGNRVLVTSTQTEDVNYAFASPVTTTAYVSFLMKLQSNDVLPANTLTTPPAGYFVHFANASGPAVTGGFSSRVGLRKGKTAGTFNIGILNTTGGTASESDQYGTNPVDYQVGQTYLVVVKYDMTGSKGISTIWVDPTNGAESTPVNSSSFGNSEKLVQVASIALREATNGGSIEVDEMRLGSSWEDVIPVSSTLATQNISSKSKESKISNTLVHDGFSLFTKTATMVEVYNISGSLVQKGNYQAAAKVDVSSLKKGIYLVKIIENGLPSVVKIIKS